MLQIENLVKSFDNKEILHGISLNVNDGEIFGFIGHNGAGKTTTIRCAVGIIPFESGKIHIDGKNILEDPIWCKSVTAFLPDNPDLYENLTGIQYLNFIADIFEMSPDTRMDKITAIGRELEIYDSLGDQIKSLSHGMKQKVALISAFMHDPRLLVLDEPFVGLDPKASFIMKNKLRELCDHGGSVFFSSHVLEVVQNLCDEIAIIKQGSIIMNGKTDEILRSGESLEQIFLDTENIAS
ncbi:MAG: ABC transporter ATP-binding protein [Solobacterium sp.]|nr:ABC transporter ATP-binding protein [Solobacterium sp.]